MIWIRQTGKNRPHIRTEDLDMTGGKTHFRRFTKWWRLAHLVGALSIMLLALADNAETLTKRGAHALIEDAAYFGRCRLTAISSSIRVTARHST